MSLRLTSYLFIALICTACGGGGGGGGGFVATSSTSSSAGSFPEFSEQPANNSVMLSCQTNVPVAPASTITGTVQYQRVPLYYNSSSDKGLDYSNIQDLPARGVVVEAVAVSAGQCTTQVVATAITNGAGQYGLDVPSEQKVCIEVRAQLYRDGSQGGASWNVQVVNNTSGQAPYYLVDNSPATPTEQPVRDLLAGAGWNQGQGSYTSERAAAPFAILDAVCEAIDTVQSVSANVQLPLLRMNWSINNTVAEGNVEEGDVGGAFYREIIYSQGSVVVDVDRDIFLLGDVDLDMDEYDPHVINHEFTHYLTSVLSRVDTIGGQHIFGDKLDPRVAFDEGFASAFAGISLDGSNPVIADGSIYMDTLGQSWVFSFDIDRNTTGSTSPYSAGWYSESSVYSLVYNAYDSSGSAFDTISLGFAPLLNVLTSDDFKNSDSLLTLFTFFHVLKQQRSPTEGSAIDLLLEEEHFELVNDAFGSEELAGNNDFFTSPEIELMEPVYLPLENGVSTEACSTNHFGGIYNKLSNGRYLRFTPPSAKTYHVNVDPVTNGIAVVEAYRRGKQIAYVEAAHAGQSVSFNVAMDGDVVIIVYDLDNYFGDGGAPGEYCFDILVN